MRLWWGDDTCHESDHGPGGAFDVILCRSCALPALTLGATSRCSFQCLSMQMRSTFLLFVFTKRSANCSFIRTRLGQVGWRTKRYLHLLDRGGFGLQRF